MDDQEFEELLHKSLRFDVAKDELQFNNDKEGQNTMKLTKFIKPIVVTAACAALVLGVSKVPDFNFSGNTPNNTSNPTRSSDSESITNMADTFTMHAYAKGQKKELKKNMSIASLISYDSVWGGDDIDMTTNYVEAFPIICDGKNIKKITYSINKGAFQIFNKTGDGFIVDGDKASGISALDVGAISPNGYDEEDDDHAIGIGYDEGYYTSFSVSPKYQSGDDIRVNICDIVKVSKKTFREFWAFCFDDATDEEKSIETRNKARNEILSKVVITCTVTYKDKTTESKKIAVGSKIMTAEEAGDTETAKKDKEAVKNGDAKEIPVYYYTTFTVL